MKIKKKPFAKKSFGQNFLFDQNYVAKIISALDPQTNEWIIEIGAGRGALTEKLVERSGRVLAIELDRDLIPVLAQKFHSAKNFELVTKDALEINFAGLTKGKKTKLVANLPYNISTAILQKLIDQRESFSEMILMFQREVADRITAEPGTRERGFLTVLVKTFLEATKLFEVPPNAFFPVPKVHSAVVRLITKNKSEINIGDEKMFLELISQSFRHKRKTIQNNLKNADGELKALIENSGGLPDVLERAGLDPNQRAETITIDKWKRLSNLLTV